MASNSEEEITLYGKINRPEGLKEAFRKVEHVQAEIKTGTGRIRVRKTTEVGIAPLYEITTKIPVSGSNEEHDHNTEHTAIIDDEFFNSFLVLATEVIKKTRYYFKSKTVKLEIHKGFDSREVPLPQLTYEVDVFHANHTRRVGWCKIDVELDGVKNYIKQNHPELGDDIPFSLDPTVLPFSPSDVFNGNDATPEQEELLSKLWSEYFVKSTDSFKESESYLFEVEDD